MRKIYITTLLAGALFFVSCNQSTKQVKFESKWPSSVTRTWIGPEYWANRLQDWQIHDEKLECVVAAADRNVNILTRQLGKQKGSFAMSVIVGGAVADAQKKRKNWAGFRIGIKGQFNDYRDSAIYGKGMNAGITMAGRLFIDQQSKDDPVIHKIDKTGIRIELVAEPAGDTYKVLLKAVNPQSGELLATLEKGQVPAESLTGNIALVSDFPQKQDLADGICTWFQDWKISGSKIEVHDNQTFGPILFSQYTLSRGILKMTAQMPPIGNKDAQTVALQVLKENGKGWKTIQEAKIDAMARTATFRIENWDAGKNTPYRLAYNLLGTGDKTKEYEWRGTIRKEPLDKDEIVVAAFTGNNDLGFPNNDLVKNVKYHNPDFLFFSGDQIYERVGGYGTQRAPLDKATLDYLRKWYLYGWAYRDILKDRPAVSIPDDHDVYHGNVWGAGGKEASHTGDSQDQQDSGGYIMPAAWVNMVQRTQTSHLPASWDPTPVKQGIGVYYCEINYGGISFAVIEDRKWKSAPKALLPEANIRNGWARNRKFNAAKEADVPGAVLLGERQLHFLHEWADNWDENTWMKVVLSQTIFANVATLPEEEATSDAVVPKLRVLKRGEYPPNDIPVADMDSDGWPQIGRNNAIREMRRAFALHIAGDQHLGSTIQYGVDDWRDAGYAFCVPAISNIWPRRWFPKNPGRNRKPGAPKYTGDFLDGFGNHVTVYAVSNPVFTGEKPATLYDRATGYGIVRFNRTSRNIVIECWPRESDPTKPDAQEYPGWPIKIGQADNYGRKAFGYLPTIKIAGISNPVVQVIDEKSGESIYTLRIRGNSFMPKVFENGSYTVRVGKETGKNMKSIKGLLVDETKEKTVTIKVNE